MFCGGCREVAVPGCHHEVGVLDCQSGCKVDCVVATQRVPLGEFAGDACERGIEAYHVQLLAQLIDASHRAPERARIDAPTSMRGCCCGTRFRVDQLAGGYGFGVIPQLCGDLRSWLVEDELDQR